MTSEKIVKFLREHPLISLNSLEEMLDIPQSTLSKAVKENSERDIPGKHIEKLSEELLHYGFNPKSGNSSGIKVDMKIYADSDRAKEFLKSIGDNFEKQDTGKEVLKRIIEFASAPSSNVTIAQVTNQELLHESGEMFNDSEIKIICY